jgi:hypothetical protein
MNELTREKQAAMTDHDLLAYEREHHGNPYMSLRQAKEMQKTALKFWHLGAARTKANRRAEAQARRRLLQRFGGPDRPKPSVIDERDEFTE